MAKFSIEITALALARQTLVIEADTEDEAQDMVYEQEIYNDHEWIFDDDESPQIQSITEVK